MPFYVHKHELQLPRPVILKPYVSGITLTIGRPKGNLNSNNKKKVDSSVGVSVTVGLPRRTFNRLPDVTSLSSTRVERTPMKPPDHWTGLRSVEGSEKILGGRTGFEQKVVKGRTRAGIRWYPHRRTISLYCRDTPGETHEYSNVVSALWSVLGPPYCDLVKWSD